MSPLVTATGITFCLLAVWTTLVQFVWNEFRATEILPRTHDALTDKKENPAAAARRRFNMGSPGVMKMMANWFYLVGSICFIVGTIINMTAQ